ncbi:MAG: hypothetical protein EAX86_03475 [Candidatus Heimdallarchaeota archaeon]|nr:hypothetical protein [Candidatus Heimdallarchaeota archaeon]
MTDSYSDILLVPFAKYLGKYGELQISNIGGSVLIPFDRSSFDSILLRPKRLSYSADKSWQFIASKTLVSEEEFTNQDKFLFQGLKGVECELKQRGVIKKYYYFTSSSSLTYLKQEIPNLMISDALSELLTQDIDLQTHLKNIKPESLNIQLYSPLINTKDPEQYLLEFKKYFKSPSSIIWNITLEKYLEGIVRKKRFVMTIDSIIQALEITTTHLEKVTKMIESRI